MVIFTGVTAPDPNLGGIYRQADVDGQRASVFFSTEVEQDMGAYGVSREELADFCKENGQLRDGTLQIRITTAELHQFRAHE